MLTFSTPPPSPISFGAVKAILDHHGLSAQVRDTTISPSLRIIHPLDAGLAEFVRAGAISLTDAATSAEQIRFFQRRRAQRSYIKIAEWVIANHGSVSIRIANSGALDTPSRDFLDIAARVCGWEIVLSPAADPTGLRYVPSEEEHALMKALAPQRITVELDNIWTAAFEYINTGDAWSGVALGRLLSNVEQSPRVWNLLALGFAMLNETENAEYYYRQWAKDGDELDRVRALYGQSMLYARHHPAGLRNLDTSAELLDEAFGVAQSIGAEHRASDAVVFEEVFNRNGYALVLFRRGEVDAALELLETGIERLTQTSEKVAIHRSVLMYNLAQCHKQLGNLDEAIEAYERLLSVDPYMPEYHLEAAKCHARKDNYIQAVAYCRNALALDDTLAVSWALLGLYLGENSEYSAAADAYAQAARLEPDTRAHVDDAAYNWILADELDRAADVLNGLDQEALSQSETERTASLIAEIHARKGDRVSGLRVLEKAIARFPESQPLQMNRGILAAS